MVDVLRPSLLGGVDGVVTSFAIVAGASATPSARTVVLVIGSSSVVADGLSMGVSEYLAATSQRALDPTAPRPALLGAACFASFVLCGAVPVLVFVLAESLLACAMFALVELMLLGAARTRVTGEPLLAGLLQTTALGGLAGAVALGVAVAARRLEGEV